MQQVFLNISLETTDRHKLSFITPFGLYEWNRFPIGQKNSPHQFSKKKTVSKTLPGLLGTMHFVDDKINCVTSFR